MSWLEQMVGTLPVVCARYLRRWLWSVLQPITSAKTLAWLVGVGIILDGVGNWVKVAAVYRVEKKDTHDCRPHPPSD